MRKIMLSACIYDESTLQGQNRKKIMEAYSIPRFKQWSARHGFEFILIKENNTGGRKHLWVKMFWMLDNWPLLRPDDRIVWIDGDSCVVNGSVCPIFKKDYSVPIDSTGILCCGFYGLRVCDWTKRFIEEQCTFARHKDNCINNAGMWDMFGDQEALHEVLGLPWEYPYQEYGTRKTTPFTVEEIKEHFEVLPVNWSVCFDPADSTSGSCIVPFFKPERYCPKDQVIIRHFPAGTIEQQWAIDYFKVPML